ncbi:MAG: 50S ribosomal protein L3 N(5)-glutamine methyltransferase [Burkholderiaceae bacterium]
MVRPLASTDEALRDLRTLRDWLRYAVSRFEAAALAYGHGTADSWDEAAALLRWLLHLPPEPLDSYLDARLCDSERRAAAALIERRIASRRPAAYLTGEAWLGGLRFICDERALVPRSLIAEALDEALPQWLAQWSQPDSRSSEWPARILDLCTGGGSLAVIAADRFPGAHVVGSDLSADALALAEVNRTEHGMQQRLTLLRGDLFEALAGERFDLILCNPPYVNADSMAALPPEFLVEPQTALAGGVDGMDLIRRLLAEAPSHLNPDGLLLIEIGHEARHFEAAFPDLEFHYLPVTAGEQMLVLIEAQLLQAAARRQPERRPQRRPAAAARRRDSGTP